MKNQMKGFLLSGLLVFGGTTMAATESANFQAAATINGTCTVSANDVNFGSLTPSLSGNSVAGATLTMKFLCSNGLPFNVKISSGSSGDVNQRTMVGESFGDKLLYNLYQGAGTRAPKVLNLNEDLEGAGQEQTQTLNAQVFLNQWVIPDNYSDSLTVEVTY